MIREHLAAAWPRYFYVGNFYSLELRVAPCKQTARAKRTGDTSKKSSARSSFIFHDLVNFLDRLSGSAPWSARTWKMIEFNVPPRYLNSDLFMRVLLAPCVPRLMNRKRSTVYPGFLKDHGRLRSILGYRESFEMSPWSFKADQKFKDSLEILSSILRTPRRFLGFLESFFTLLRILQGPL